SSPTPCRCGRTRRTTSACSPAPTSSATPCGASSPTTRCRRSSPGRTSCSRSGAASRVARMYEVLLAVHILAAVLWVGGGVTVNTLVLLARREGGARLLSSRRQAIWLAPRFYAPLALILLVAGFLLVDEAGYELGDLFFSLALLGWLISFVLGMAFYPSQQR